MAKPRLIILIRHAQSEGNKNREIHQTIPDHRVKLTQDGLAQARDAGRRLKKLLRPDDTLHFFTSPYRRTRETTEGILETLTAPDQDDTDAEAGPRPSPFQRSDIKVYEEPRLREQDFGNFQPCSAEMERMWQERADYGHFFYRIPNGESAADAYDRVSGFNESLWRQFGEDDFASVCVLVTHGLMSRVFLMKWYHFTVEYFEDLRNVNHCEFLIMRKEDSGKYHLENKLRTWSELRKERALAAHNDSYKHTPKFERSKTFVSARRWGGCPNGCNHTSHYKMRDDLEVLRQQAIEHDARHCGSGPNSGHSSTTSFVTTTTAAGSASTTITVASRRHRHPPAISSDEEGETGDDLSDALATPDIDVSSPSGGTRSFQDDKARRPKPSYLHVGRDFGGSYSGHNSLAGSDTDASEDEARRRHRLATRKPGVKTSLGNALDVPVDESDDYHREGHTPCVNRLGDAPASGCETGSDREACHEDDGEEYDIDRAEKEDRSIRGSVY
jgi:broad specificity phosphatase PhoE